MGGTDSWTDSWTDEHVKIQALFGRFYYVYLLFNEFSISRKRRSARGKGVFEWADCKTNKSQAKQTNKQSDRQTDRQTNRRTERRTDSAIKWGCNTAAAAATRLDRINQFMQALKTRIKMLKQNQNQRNPQ